MPRPRKAESQNTRALAVAAVDALLHQHGYMGVSMDAVAEATGVRKASLYHHFPEGKEALVLEFAEQAIDFDAAGFQQAIETHATARGQLEAIARHISGQRRETARVLRDAMRFMRAEHQEHLYKRFYQAHYLKVKAVMDLGVKRKEFKRHDTEFSAWAFLDLMSEMKSSQYGVEEVAARVVELIVEGIGK